MSTAAVSNNGVHLFGIRHLSPTGAYHLQTFLNEVKPELVLVEGPSDATELIGQITLSGVKPPIAILAYTEQLPIRTLVFPLAEYSPEYQAFQWAERHGAEARFIDLPSAVSVSLHTSLSAASEKEELAEAVRLHRKEVNNRYEEVALRAGDSDYETYWERSFEHCNEPSTYRRSIHTFSSEMRTISEAEERMYTPLETAHNDIREAYMRAKIAEAIAEGIPAEKIVVVIGAYHVSGLEANLEGITEEEVASLPKISTKLTLMPYSYYKLSSQSGYGAGNVSPYYFELAWQCLVRGTLPCCPLFIWLQSQVICVRVEHIVLRHL